MSKFPPTTYKLMGFMVSPIKNKKYTAILVNKVTGREKLIHFGDSRYQQYRDRLGVYSYLDHGDEKRRKNYIKRHSAHSFKPYSANYFSRYYLW